MRSRLKLWNESGTKRARIALLPKPDTFTATSRAEALRMALDQVYTGSTSGGLGVKSLRAGVESEVVRVNMIHAGCADDAARSSAPSPRGPSSRGEGRGEGLSPRAVVRGDSPSSGLLRADLSPRGEGRGDFQAQFVFATRGGIADVTNDVASSIAGPNGVGIVMRNGTSTRVPAIGTKAISIWRSVARYLITGRSGM